MLVSQQGDLSEFEDNTLVSDWAKDSVVWAVGSGLMSGRGDAELVPQGNVTRAETAALIDRFVKLSGTAEN
ncbi:MAG: S-layer homology domain-containing protein [Clostridia bacterium]|nr:S-layer homology domain-containing protein [Clostridia bacterium]